MSKINTLIAKTLAGIVGKEMTSTMFQMVTGISRKPPKRGTEALLKAYNTLPWFRAILNKVAKSTSTQTWKVFVDKSKDGKIVRNHKLQRSDFNLRSKMIKKGLRSGDLVELDNHPILQVLNEGNELLRGYANLQVAQTHIDSVGETFLLKERDGLGTVKALWPIPPFWIKTTPLSSQPFYELSYREVQANIPFEEIIWIKDPDPSDPYQRGSGVGVSLADELETDEYAAKHTRSWFFNNARPDMIISAAGLQKGDTQRLEEDWLNKHQGFMKRFKPHFMNADVKVTQLNQSFKDMQLTKLREFERDLFIQVFGIPPEILGIVENSNRATIESADYIYSKWVIVPRLELQRSCFQAELVPEYDERLILDYESPVMEDKEHRLNTMSAASWAFPIDEWRDLAGEEPLPDDKGQVHMVPFSLMPVSDFSEIEDTGMETLEIEEEKRYKYFPKSNKVKAELSADGLALVSRVVRSIDAQVTVDALVPTIRSTVSSFGQTMTNTLGDIDFSIADPRVSEFLGTRSVSRIRTFVDSTTRNRLRKSLVDGLAAGETTDDIAKRINKVFDGASSNRAKVIARTETVRAANFGSQEGMAQAGVERKQWLSSRGPNVRDSHSVGLGLDGHVVEIRSNFKSPVTGAEGPHPGDLGTAADDVNCVCTLVPIFEGEEARTHYSEEVKTSFWRTFEKDRKPFELKMRREIRKAFEIQRSAALQALEE